MRTKMSRKATMEYVGVKRRVYSELKSKEAKSAAIDDFCMTTGLTRKYAIKLLTGNRKYREHKGRGKTYTFASEALFLRLWRASGRMTPQYLVTVLPQQMSALCELEHVDSKAKEQVLKMSASTMERILRSHPCEAPRRRNRRSGANTLSSSIPCVPGEATPPKEPGDTQADTVALCGGDMSDNFFWILNQTDRFSQWTQCHPVWNRGAANTCEALSKAEKEFPFTVLNIHSDSGHEFMNAHVLRYAKEREVPLGFTRSRLGNKNDNPRVEQKNCSVVREYFGHERIDRLELLSDMEELCNKINLYNNLFRPCKRLIYKAKRPDRHGYEKKYDKPCTPLERVIQSGIGDEQKIKKYVSIRDAINPISLLEDIRRRYNLIMRKQQKIYKGQMSRLNDENFSSPAGEEAKPVLK
jgi:hypothetical protein